MTLTEEKFRGDDCPVVVEAISDTASATATTAFPIPSAPPAPAGVADDATNTQNSDDIRSARYFKNPTSDMLESALQTQKTSGGVLFVTLPTNYRGKFTVPKSIKAGHLLSDDKIDLSYADFVHPVTKITAGAILGGLKVVVPKGVRVEMQGIGILGSFEYRHKGQTVGVDHDSPLVVLKGFSILGGVDVKVNESVPPVRVMH
mmetsp:Transcript_10021/g.23425  ORF Transcript_10021/g.23425 Transcript_10021/m.23425 type:complete len:203 (-) Transcript_10021:320-928(-)